MRERAKIATADGPDCSGRVPDSLREVASAATAERLLLSSIEPYAEASGGVQRSPSPAFAKHTLWCTFTPRTAGSRTVGGELAFGAGSERDDHVKAAVLTGSLVAALLAAVVLRRRNRHYRALEEAEAGV